MRWKRDAAELQEGGAEHDDVVSRARILTRQLLGGKPTASVDAFLTERHREASEE
jgi:hypothetical protein